MKQCTPKMLDEEARFITALSRVCVKWTVKFSGGKVGYCVVGTCGACGFVEETSNFYESHIESLSEIEIQEHAIWAYMNRYA